MFANGAQSGVPHPTPPRTEAPPCGERAVGVVFARRTFSRCRLICNDIVKNSVQSVTYVNDKDRFGVRKICIEFCSVSAELRVSRR